MALINCGECGKEVSDKAANCPNCGAPIASAKETRAAGAPLTTVQETSKKLKLQIVVSSIMFWIGSIWIMVVAQSPAITEKSYNTAIILLGVGITWYIITRFRIWWHHK
jgi:uncharacterized membrane protein YvbJ